MANKIRLVICQLECHPAFYIDRTAFLEEPFVPDSEEDSLSNLGAFGIPGVIDLKTLNKGTYLEWDRQRIIQLISHPLLNEDITRIIVFPEGSISLENLLLLHEFSSKTNAIVVAGSHTIQRTVQANNIYKTLGKQKQLSKFNRQLGQVAFVFAGSKISAWKKRTLSPFERTDVSSLLDSRVKVVPIVLPITDDQLRLLPLVCAEALQNPKVKGDYDISSIISYTKKPEYFDPYIETEVRRSKVIMYVNDAKFGGSRICMPMDQRQHSWFFGPPLNGRLPKGESMLVIDIPTGDRAAQAGVVNPKAQYEIKLLGAITYSKSRGINHEISKELIEISKIDENNARCARLSALKQRGMVREVHKAKVDFLEDLARTGTDQKAYWDAFGCDVVINLPSLTDLETELAERNASDLLPLLAEDELGETAVKSLKKFIKKCRKRGKSGEKIITQQPPKESVSDEALINREAECSEVLRFFDSKTEYGIQVTGLPSIGKTATITKALSYAGFYRINRIELSKASSSEFIFAKILGKAWDESLPVNEDLSELIFKNESRQILKGWDLLWFINCESLVVGRGWRSKELEGIIYDIVTIAKEENLKIIFESTVELPFDLEDSSVMAKMRIKGFEKQAAEHGVSLLNKQLRRLGLSPADIIADDKTKLVRKLGGHPLAIIFCADALYEEGLSNVFEVIEKGSGFYQKVIDRIMRLVTLTEEEERMLRLLAGSHTDVPRDLLSSLCEFPVAEPLLNLSRQCLVEVVSPNTIFLPGVLRNRFRFRELDAETQHRFHEEAAKFYTLLAERYQFRTEYAIAAELHSRFAGQKSRISTGLIDGHITQAYELYNDRKFKEAAQVLEMLLKTKQSTDILRLAALVDAELGKHDEALAKAKSVLKHNSSDTYLFRRLSQIALFQSREDIAEKLVIIAQDSQIDETSIFLVQGHVAIRRKDLDKAEWCYERARNSTRNNAWPFFYLGKILISTGEFDEAVTVLYDGLTFCEDRQWLRGNAKNAIATKLGIAYVLNNNLDAAFPIINSLIEAFPEDPEVVQAYALMIVKKDGLENAAEAFEKFSKIKPRTWRQKGHYNLFYGLFLLEINQISKANDCFALAHKYEPSNVYIMIKYAENLFQLALSSEADEEMDIAKDLAMKCAQIMKKILEFNPENYIGDQLRYRLYKEFEIELSKI